MNTRKVNNMSRLFEGCDSLDSSPDISSLDIGNVTDIRGIFYNCKNLKKIPDIFCWNTSKVTTMKEMFWPFSNLNYKDLPDITQ